MFCTDVKVVEVKGGQGLPAPPAPMGKVPPQTMCLRLPNEWLE